MRSHPPPPDGGEGGKGQLAGLTLGRIRLRTGRAWTRAIWKRVPVRLLVPTLRPPALKQPDLPGRRMEGTGEWLWEAGGPGRGAREEGGEPSRGHPGAGDSPAVEAQEQELARSLPCRAWTLLSREQGVVSRSRCAS